MRLALGASRWRLIRQLLTESLLISLTASIVGLLLAAWGIDLILGGMPPEVAKYVAGWGHIKLDFRATLFTVVVAMLAGVLSGLAPAFQCSRPNLNETLKEGGRTGATSYSKQRVRNIFVVGEVALSLVLLIGAGLMTKGVRALFAGNQTADPDRLLTLRINLPDPKYENGPKRAQFYEDVLREIATIPEVEGAAVASNVPYGKGGRGTRLSIEGQRIAEQREYRVADLQDVSPNYFHVMNLALRDGRAFGRRDGSGSVQTVIVSQRLAKRYWPGESALGKRLKFGRYDSDTPWLTVVGVVEDVQYDWFDRESAVAVYRPMVQEPSTSSYFVIRTTRGPRQIISSVRKQIARVDPGQPLYEIKTFEKVLSDSVIGLSYVAVMLSVLGVIALILSTVGVYGVMAYSVSERTHEIGVRMALGAGASDILRMVIRRGLLLTGIGLAIGLPISIGLARLLSSLLFGVSATDLTTYGGLSLLLLAVAMVACSIPARRATRVDPIIALRCE